MFALASLYCLERERLTGPIQPTSQIVIEGKRRGGRYIICKIIKTGDIDK